MICQVEHLVSIKFRVLNFRAAGGMLGELCSPEQGEKPSLRYLGELSKLFTLMSEIIFYFMYINVPEI